MALIRSDEYREVVADRVAGIPKAKVSQMTVVHEPDDSCCLREPWAVSLARLLATVGERRSVTSLVMGIGSDLPAEIKARRRAEGNG